MTYSEAIEVLSDFGKQAHAKADGAYQTNDGAMACIIAIDAIRDLQKHNKMLDKIMDELNKKKEYFQNFYNIEGRTEEDSLINNATQLAFDEAIEIIKNEYNKEKKNNGNN